MCVCVCVHTAMVRERIVERGREEGEGERERERERGREGEGERGGGEGKEVGIFVLTSVTQISSIFDVHKLLTLHACLQSCLGVHCLKVRTKTASICTCRFENHSESSQLQYFF